MLIGYIEELEWPDQAHGAMQVRIRHRGSDGQLYEVAVEATGVDLGAVPNSQATREGSIDVRLGPGRFKASLVHGILFVRPSPVAPPPAHGHPRLDLRQPSD